MATSKPNTTAEMEASVLKSFAIAEKTCTSPWVLAYSQALPGTSMHFHELMLILAAVACIISCLFAMYLICGHLLHWTRPREQKQIVRIVLFIPAFSLCSFWSIWFYQAQGYIAPWGEWYEAFALNALFLLYVEIAAPSDLTMREAFFHNLERRWYTGKKKSDKGSLRWYRGLYLMVFQLFFTRIGTVLAAEFLYGFTCPLSTVRAHGQTVITTIQSFSTGFAVWGCILLDARFRPIMHEHLAQLKLISFKFVVLLQAVQEVIFPTLAEHRIFKPSPPWLISWNDFAVGLPQFLLVWEMVLVAITFIWAFHFNRYRTLMLRDHEDIVSGPGKAFLDILDLTDIWQTVAYAFFGIRSTAYPHQRPIDDEAVVAAFTDNDRTARNEYEAKSANDRADLAE